MKKREFSSNFDFIIILIFMLFLFLIGPIKAAGSDNANVTVSVLLVPRIIVYHPEENTTYNFSLTDDIFLDLNVSALGGFLPIQWNYTLKNATGYIINDSVEFTPNTTINPVEGRNFLNVSAVNSSGVIRWDSVNFFVSILDTSPVLDSINDTFYVCEASFMDYDVSATDIDSDSLEFSLDNPDPFYVFPSNVLVISTIARTTIISSTLNKTQVGVYPLELYVTDGEFSDTAAFDIEVIEINNLPQVEILGANTIWTMGDNSTFYEEVSVDDVESGNSTTGNFTFNLTFYNETELFNISEYGVINFTAEENQTGVYTIGLCVTDQPLDPLRVSENISLCGQNGSAITSCQNFSLTITDENRPPTILDYYPNSTNFTTTEGVLTYLNATEYDPDGTYPDAYWYVDDILKERDVGNLTDEFEYVFGYDDSGNHTITLVVSDGLLNDSFQWNVTVLNGVPPELPSGEGGGGGGASGTSGFVCLPLWVCNHWTECKPIKLGLESGELSQESYRNVINNCTSYELDEGTCGYQTRECRDLNNCGGNQNKPDEYQKCTYTGISTCFDGIKNCHDNSCEVLVDCGGPCRPCPSCSDGVMNQGEKGIDCGGPCPWKCEEERPLQQKINLWYILLFVLILILIALVVKIIRMLQEHIEEQEQIKE
ncbi:hypothetical protein K9L16_02315 [Candidatus Pacearchaeota archaeon]|nr:hypothetical protein [Candidatus Pacearchaeota archaeon]